MNTQLFSLGPLVLATMLLGATGAQAGITVYTSQSAFNAAVTAPGVDTFDDLTIKLYDSTLTRTAGVYSYTVSSENGLYGAGVSGDHWLSNNSLANAMVFSGFSGGATAFGGNFFGSDLSGQFLANTSMMLTAMDGTTASYTLTNSTTGSFLGFLSDSPLQSVTLISQGTYWPTANNVTLAMAEPAVVPEPGTYSLLVVALALLGFATRRRQGVR